MKKNILSILFVISCHAANSQSISKAEFKDEMAITVSFLSDIHANPFKYQLEEELNSIIDSILQVYSTRDSIPILNAFQCYSNLVSSIKCAHSGVYKSKELDALIHPFPYKIRVINKRGFIAKDYLASNLNAGDEIGSINGVSWDIIFNEGTNLHSSDGNSPLNIELFERRASLDIPLIVGNYPYYELTVISTGQDTVTLRSRATTDSLNTPKTGKFVFSIVGFKKNIGLITVINFPSNALEIREFEKFCRKTRDRIKSKKLEDIIIDLRNNGGGDRLDILLRYFTPKSFPMIASSILDTTNISKYRGKIVFHNLSYEEVVTIPSQSEQYRQVDFQGNLYLNVNLFVFVNGRTASAASHFASLVKENKLGKIVGSETGGRASGCNGNVYCSYFLPYSGIEIFIPLMKNVYAVNQVENPDQGVIPDILIQKELLKNLEMMKLIELINEHNSH